PRHRLHESDHLLVARARLADDGTLGDIGPCRDDLFNFRRKNIETSADDHLLDPARHAEITLQPEDTYVTRMEPAIEVHGLPCLSRITKVALHHIRPANPDLAALALRHCATLRIAQRHLDTRN